MLDAIERYKFSQNRLVHEIMLLLKHGSTEEKLKLLEHPWTVFPSTNLERIHLLSRDFLADVYQYSWTESSATFSNTFQIISTTELFYEMRVSRRALLNNLSLDFILSRGEAI